MNFLYNIFNTEIYIGDCLFFSLFSGTLVFTGYKLIYSNLNSSYVDKGIQTDAWENFSNRSSLIISENNETSTIMETTSNISPVTTILPVPQTHIEMVPNLDIINILVDQGVQTINLPLLDPSVINSIPITDIIII